MTSHTHRSAPYLPELVGQVERRALAFGRLGLFGTARTLLEAGPTWNAKPRHGSV